MKTGYSGQANLLQGASKVSDTFSRRKSSNPQNVVTNSHKGSLRPQLSRQSSQTESALNAGVKSYRLGTAKIKKNTYDSHGTIHSHRPSTGKNPNYALKAHSNTVAHKPGSTKASMGAPIAGTPYNNSAN